MLRGHVRLGLLLVLGGVSCLRSDFPPADDASWQCNQDLVCDPDENQVSCPDDCVWSEATGEGDSAEVCDAQENWTFVEACLETCGNGQEDQGETAETCPRDFPEPTCGDGICGVDEDPAQCPVECHGGSCGDGVCDPHENANICGKDCGAGCGDGTCDAGEEVTCTRDCEPCQGDACVCGDMVCGPGESMATCPEDCTAASCGNGAMEDGEACDDGNQIDTDACTSQCEMAACGDGIVWAGEETCDDGADNGPGKPCSATCEANACGDGDVGPGETCDDGNDIDTDDCTNACEPAACGDGSIWEGEEECDDGNPIDTDDCTNACLGARCGDEIVWAGEEQCDDGNMVDTDSCSNACVERRVIFVTSAEFKGDLGGMSGADAKCVMAATDAGLTNTTSFKAWLSTSSNWPAKRLDTAYVGMYMLVDGTTVVENGWTDLTNGALMHAIDLTEAGAKANTAPWTNTKADGTPVGGEHCEFWTNDTAGSAGGFGLSGAADATWTDSMDTVPCSAPSPLYCIEDP
jgi:cysteine-rich repeat protein